MISLWLKKASLLIVVCLLLGCAGTRPRAAAPAADGKDAAYYYLLSEIETRRSDPFKALKDLDRAIEK